MMPEPVINAASEVSDPLLKFILIAMVAAIIAVGFGFWWLLKDQKEQRDALNAERAHLLENLVNGIAELRTEFRETTKEIKDEIQELREDIEEEPREKRSKKTA